MKKNLKTLTAFLLLLTLITTINPITLPEDSQPGITVQGDDDDPTVDDDIRCY